MKNPFGSTKTVVRVAPDFPVTNRVFAGTSGNPSAFFISTDRGLSFNGEALINNGSLTVGAIDGIELSPDGASLYLATHTAGFIFLYRSTTPVAVTSWSLILVKPKSGSQAILEISRDWPNTPSVYLTDKSAGGNIHVSADAGNTFSTRNAPAGVLPTAMSAPGGTTVYLAGGPTGSSVFRSVNNAFVWEKQAESGISGIASLKAPDFGTVIAGGDGAVSYSKDGGNSFTRIDTGLAPAANYQVATDPDFAVNKMVFAGGSVAAATGNIYRFVIGTSDKWENTNNGAGTPGKVVDIATVKGTLYAMGTSTTGRSLNPTVAIGSVPGFAGIKANGVTGARWLTSISLPDTNILYTANDVDPTPQIWALSDYLAVTMPILISPPNRFIVPVNPATGLAEDVTFTWQPVGSGNTMVNTIDFEIYRKTPEIDAGKYVTKIKVDPTNPFVRIVAGGTTAGNVIGYDMQPGWEYTWDIRFVDTVNGAGLVSRWCASSSVIIQAGGKVVQQYEGPQLTGPAPGASGQDPVAIGFTWAPVSGAAEYQVIIATDAGLSQYAGGTPAVVAGTAFQAEALEYARTYFWAVRALKPVESVQVVGTFTTMPRPEPQPVPPAVTLNPAPPVDFEPPETNNLPLFIWGVIAIGVFLVVALLIRFALSRR